MQICQIVEILELLYRVPYTDPCQIRHTRVDPWSTLTRQFYRFLLFCGGSTQRCADNVERGYKSTNIPFSKDTKVVSIFQRVDGEVQGVHNLCHSKARRTKKNKKRLTFSLPSGVRCPISTKLGMVIEVVRTSLVSPKRVRIRRMVSPQKDAENLW